MNEELIIDCRTKNEEKGAEGLDDGRSYKYALNMKSNTQNKNETVPVIFIENRILQKTRKISE